VVTRRRARGYTMMEIVITLALFGVFLFIIVTMTSEMRRNEKKWPVNFFTHPDVGSVLARMRRDVYDSTLRPPEFETYSNNSPLTLIVYTINNDGTAETVVWDFTTPGEAHRKAFKATLLSSEWVARGLPMFAKTMLQMPSGQDAIRIQAMDKENKLAIDELIVPRPHAE
jgi:prepilin-type N-terminal cleavage/methylation domain-containing protein